VETEDFELPYIIILAEEVYSYAVTELEHTAVAWKVVDGVGVRL
jgi:hypothetical protein